MRSFVWFLSLLLLSHGLGALNRSLVLTKTRKNPSRGTLHSVAIWYEPVALGKPLPKSQKLFNFSRREQIQTLEEQANSCTRAQLHDCLDTEVQEVATYFSEQITKFTEHKKRHKSSFSCVFKTKEPTKTTAVLVTLQRPKNQEMSGHIVIYGRLKEPPCELVNLIVASTVDDALWSDRWRKVFYAAGALFAWLKFDKLKAIVQKPKLPTTQHIETQTDPELLSRLKPPLDLEINTCVVTIQPPQSRRRVGESDADESDDDNESDEEPQTVCGACSKPFPFACSCGGEDSPTSSEKSCHCRGHQAIWPPGKPFLTDCSDDGDATPSPSVSPGPIAVKHSGVSVDEALDAEPHAGQKTHRRPVVTKNSEKYSIPEITSQVLYEAMMERHDEDLPDDHKKDAPAKPPSIEREVRSSQETAQLLDDGSVLFTTEKGCARIVIYKGTDYIPLYTKDVWVRYLPQHLQHTRPAAQGIYRLAEHLAEELRFNIVKSDIIILLYCQDYYEKTDTSDPVADIVLKLLSAPLDEFTGMSNTFLPCILLRHRPSKIEDSIEWDFAPKPKLTNLKITTSRDLENTLKEIRQTIVEKIAHHKEAEDDLERFNARHADSRFSLSRSRPFPL